MIESENKKLLERNNEYLSIGITEGGEPRDITHVPWERTAHAYNMKIPNVYLSAEDLCDEELMKTLHGYEVIGCYIYTPLESYDFLSSFTALRDLNIRRAENLVSLDFARELRECSMLYLEGARLVDLNPIVEAKKSVKGIFGGFKCLGLYDCKIEDISALYEVSFSELIIWSRNEKERWSEIPASTHEYYEI